MTLQPRHKRTAANAWIECIDPLNGLSIAQAKSTYNTARRHGSPLLQKIYAEIESADPVLMTCVERRQSALSGLGWRAVADASAENADRAEEQRRALEDFANGIENLDDAIEHLDLAFFRGYSVVQPIWQGGEVRTVSLLDSWNFLRGEDGRLLWNPDCSPDPAACQEITPAARVVALMRRRAIDWPALIVYIRKYIGERDWGRFLERYGVPPVDVVMAQGTTNEQRDEYVETAEAARDGRPAAWPAGSLVSRAEGARGQDPFSAFIEHQEKQIVLMATGGTLTSLAQADTGSLAGGAQMDVWEQIVSRDGVVISNALNRGLFLPFLRQAFPGEEPLARLVIGKEDEPTANEAADLAVKLHGAGYTIDQSQLEEATGFKLEKEAPAPAPSGPFGGLAFNKAAPSAPKPLANRLQNAPGNSDAQGEVADAPALLGPFLRALADDCKPLANEVEILLKDPTPEKAKELLAKLPDMCPSDPTLAPLIAEEMAKAYGEEFTQAQSVAANKQDANGAEHAEAGSGNGGQFVSKGEGASGAPSGTTESSTTHTPATPEVVEKFKQELPEKISSEEFDALLTAGFTDTDGAGNSVKYGTLLRDHIDNGSRNEQDREARKARLGVAVKMVRATTPMPTGTDGKPHERIYSGVIGGKAYIAIADEHNEIGAIEMVSYRRDGKHDEK